MKKLLISLGIIAAIAAVVTGVTISYFSDTETSVGNEINSGVIDIVVDDQNPWTNTYSGYLDDMKPCQTRWIEFTARNSVYSNPINLWKHIHITDQVDGYVTEPECEEGGGEWVFGETVCTDAADCCEGNYVPRNNLASYIVYDMWVCLYSEAGATDLCSVEAETNEPIYNTGWTPIIREEQYVRMDNISSAWIHLGQLQPGQEMRVVQSYHLMSWPDAPDAEVTNWAQGDKLTFDIDVMGTQIDGPGPKGYHSTLTLDNKDTNWDPIDDDIKATMTYKTEGAQFDYSLAGTVKNAGEEYCLIYYADPWPGSGNTGLTGALIGKATSAADKSISIANTQVELDTDLPNSGDDNYPAGAKIWLIPCSDYDTDVIGDQGEMTGWHHAEYLFEEQVISYDDTDL